MSHILRIELSDDMYRIAEEAARRAGTTVEEWAASRLHHSLPQEPSGNREQPRPSETIMKWAGAFDMPRIASDNEALDRLLIEEYLDRHEDEA